MIIYYINLEHRNDRRIQLEKEISTISLPKERIDAIYFPCLGSLGCTLSHIKTLERFIDDTEHNECIILEDDFEFTRNFQELKIPDIPWDVIMLSGNVMKEDYFNTYLNKVYDCQTTSGYMVNKKFAKILLNNFNESAHLLTKTRDRLKYSLDIYWKILQPISNWYIYSPKFGKQRESFSDIEYTNVNYLC
jgi:GR25 family glycosyltransferase involved in LPS biosynthesis